MIKATFKLLDEGEKEIKFDEKYKDIILILGNTGSGKSTFTQWLAGDNTKLISKETSEGTDEYIIEDRNRISNNTLKSKTIFPELVIDNKTNSAFYDCPGFSDTQGTSHEIAETYFIKKVVDYSKSVKMVFVINHSSVEIGVDRQDFMKLMRHINDLVKDFEKFKNSFALVATKVDAYNKKGPIEDKYVIAAIAGFLEEAKKYLVEESSSRSNLSEKEKIFYKNAIKFIEIVLEKESDQYTRIGLFRRPDRPGPVSEIELLQNNKRSIEKILHEKLQFTSKNSDDFGYTVSEKTKNDISDIVNEINKNLESSLIKIARKIQEYYKNLVKHVRDKINLMVSDPDGSFVVNFSEADNFKDKFKIGYYVISELMNKTTNLTNLEELAVIVNKSVENLDIDVTKQEIAYIENQGKYFNFLQTVSDKKLGSKPWNQVFKEAKKYFEDSKKAILQDVKSAAENIKKQYETNLNDIVKGLQEKYSEKVMSLEIQKLPEKINRDARFITELSNEIEKGITTEKLVKSIVYIFENLGVSLPKENLQIIGNQGKYLRFLEVISNQSLLNGTTTWLPPFKNMAKYFYESEKWYTFLEHLYNKLSEYEIQKDRQIYNVANLDDWGQPGKNQGISVTPYNFEKFLKKIESYNVPEYDTVKNLKTTGIQVEELNQILSLTLKHKSKVICSEQKVVVKGSFVILSEIMQNLKSNSDPNDSCNNFDSNIGDGNYNLFKVFAFHRVFIDTDLSFSGKNISVTIISPKWEIIGSSRIIDLSGADGPPPAKPKANNGAHPGSNGGNGVPGNPGGSAESFFGVGDTFVNGDKLKIIANGGNGGTGQEGGDGCPGIPGKDAPKPIDGDPICDWTTRTLRGFRCALLNWESYDFLDFTEQYNYRIFGERGGKGGNGGDGGKGGKGGDLGNIVILDLQNPSKITKLAYVGEEGNIGKGGIGHQGGKDGNHQLAKFTKKKDFFTCAIPGSVCQYHTSWELKETETITTRGADGINGGDGKNEKNIQNPTAAKGVGRLPNIINEYKSYLRENINNRFQKFFITSFLDVLNSKNYVRKLYDILALIDEFQGLEKQFPELGKQIDFSPFYISLLERIYAYAEDQKDIQIDGRKVLNYIYTATLGKIYYLRENSEKLLIIDMRKYLDMVENNFKTLKDLQVISNKVDVINKYKENYKSSIDTKIKEAQSLIEKQLNPEMIKINAEIDEQVNLLIKETIDLQKQSEKEYEEKAKKKKALQDAMAIKGIFNCIKIIGGVANLMGPYGQIVGTVINGVSSVAEPFALSKELKEKLNISSNIESSSNSLKEKIDALREKKIGLLEKLLKNAEEEIKKDPEVMGDLTKKIEGIREKIQKIRDKELDFKNIKNLETEFENSIKIKGLEFEKIKGNKKIIDASKALKKIGELFKFGSLFPEMIGQYKEDIEGIEAVTKSMGEIAGTIDMLREYERSIYDTIAPMLKNMEEEMKDISDKLKTKSHVALDVTKWQIQSSLKDMKLQMQRLTEGRGVKDDLSRSIEKLNEVMTTLINIYDRMQTYTDQQNLADYIADISSVTANNINIKDQQLAKAVNNLEYVIRGNLVLEQYKSAIDALRQWVFPFADHYIEKSMLPKELQLDTNIENLLQAASRQIEAIRQKLHLYDTSIMEGDQYLQCEEFNSRYLSSQPFYVWENEENRKSISKLLSGKEVVLKADIKESPPDKEAIKFSEIDFDFKTKNDTVQSLLSEILRGFDIRATHLGNSYYKYEHEIFLITSDSVTISYSFQKNDDGMPIRWNEGYTKLKSGDLLLSPYAFWEVKLINKTNKYSFQDFNKYRNEINIELSGLGSYILENALGFAENNSFTIEDTTFENNTIAAPGGTGLRNCKRSKYRSTRSVNRIVVDGDFMTNDASKGIFSPIDFLHNFFKTYFVSNVALSINQAFFEERSFGKKDCSELCEERIETRNNAPTVMSILSVADTESTFSGNYGTKERITQTSDTVLHVNFHENDSCSETLLLSHQKYGSSNDSIKIPDLNFSLILADLVTRTITHNKYKQPLDECLLSPREVVLGKISNGLVHDENDVKEMLQCFLSEKEVREPSSWFSKLKNYAKSIIEVLGLNERSDTEEYLQDIRNLFV